ncbi:unnamed protein product [Rhizophagus irregularis]|nr:unnamed protein product [Rhizophagus irregularis]
MNFYEPDLKVRAPIFRIGKIWNSGRNYEPDFVCVKGTPERIHEPDFGWKVIRERRKRKRKETFRRFSGLWTYGIQHFERFSGLWTYGIQHFERFKRSLDVWNSTFRKVQTVLERMEFNISKVFTGFYFGTGHLIHE